MLITSCVHLQRYIWWKKSTDVWTKDHPFPIDIDYMITDTLELLRPKMRFCFSLDEATKQVIDLEREVLIKLGMRDTPACRGPFFQERRDTNNFVHVQKCVRDVVATDLAVPAQQHSPLWRWQWCCFMPDWFLPIHAYLMHTVTEVMRDE